MTLSRLSGYGPHGFPVACKRRVGLPGAIYHVMSRADRGEEIYRGKPRGGDAMAVERLHDPVRSPEARMEAGRGQELGDAAREPLRRRRGWCLGSVAFRRELRERMEGELGEHQAGELRREGTTTRLQEFTRRSGKAS